MEGEGVGAVRREQEIDAKGHLLSGKRHRGAAHPLTRSKMPALVELTVIRQEHLWHDAEQPAAMDRDAAIIETPPPAKRRADHKHRAQLSAGGDKPRDLPDHGIEHRVLKQQI